MKQLITIIRAEGEMAAELKRLFMTTRPDLMPELRDDLKVRVKTNACLSTYVEFVDDWSMGDDFERALGPGTKKKYVPMGVVYYRSVTPKMADHVQREARRRHQFPTQTFLSKTVANVAMARITKSPAMIVLFREMIS